MWTVIHSTLISGNAPVAFFYGADVLLAVSDALSRFVVCLLYGRFAERFYSEEPAYLPRCNLMLFVVDIRGIIKRFTNYG